MLHLFILLSHSGGVGPVDLSGWALLVSTLFVFLTFRVPRNSAEQLAKYHVALFLAYGIITLCDKGFGQAALLGIIVAMFYNILWTLFPDKKKTDTTK